MCFVNIFSQYSLTKYGFWCALKVHLSIFLFPFSFHVPPPARYFVPRTMRTYFFTILQKYILSIIIYNITLQNTDFGVLQKSSKHFLISIFFQMGRGVSPTPPHPPPTRHFVASSDRRPCDSSGGASGSVRPGRRVCF